MSSTRLGRSTVPAPRSRRPPRVAWVALAGLLYHASLLGGCSAREDVAALVLSDATLASDVGTAGEDEFTEADPAAASAITVVGHPLRSTHWPDPLARWPLSAPLAEFFARARSAPKPVRVGGADGELLRELWQAVERGEYGSRRNVVGVVDGIDERYLLVFHEP